MSKSQSERITISMPAALAKWVEKKAKQQSHNNFSRVIQDLVNEAKADEAGQINARGGA